MFFLPTSHFLQIIHKRPKLCKAIMLGSWMLGFLFPVTSQTSGWKVFPPLSIPLETPGTFCEIRGNHFHGGIDLRTQQKEGFPVFAADEGYVRRIYMQPSGYGHMLALDHPSGYTTVYAHLQSFIPEIQARAHALQKETQKLKLDTLLLPYEIRVKRGQIIGYSGNTGGSTGPHLHYEVRETKTQIALDPLDFGLNLMDKVPPVFHQLYLYAIEATPQSWRCGTPQLLGQAHRLSVEVPLDVSAPGTYGLACSVSDQMSGSSFKNGVRTLSLWMDEALIFELQLDRLSFVETRYLNAHVDYAASLQGKEIRRLFILPNNLLSNYLRILGSGTFTLKSGETRRFRLETTDQAKNLTTFRFSLRAPEIADGNTLPSGAFQMAGKSGKLEHQGLVFEWSHLALYQDEILRIKPLMRSGPDGFPVWEIGQETIPLHDDAFLKIPYRYIPSPLRPFVAGAVQYKGKWTFCATSHQDSMVVIRTNDLGHFTLLIDSLPPKIFPPDLTKPLKRGQTLIFQAKDAIAGLASGQLTLNGQFIPGAHLAGGRFSFNLPKDMEGFVYLTFSAIDRLGQTATHTQMVEIQEGA
jgi:hypothetical protein